MDDLKSWWTGLGPQQKQAAATRIGVTKGALSNVVCGLKDPSPLVAAGLEVETGGLVTRQQLRPHDWKRIWIELAHADQSASAQETEGASS